MAFLGRVYSQYSVSALPASGAAGNASVADGLAFSTKALIDVHVNVYDQRCFTAGDPEMYFCSLTRSMQDDKDQGLKMDLAFSAAVMTSEVASCRNP